MWCSSGWLLCPLCLLLLNPDYLMPLSWEGAVMALSVTQAAWHLTHSRRLLVETRSVYILLLTSEFQRLVWRTQRVTGSLVSCCDTVLVEHRYTFFLPLWVCTLFQFVWLCIRKPWRYMHLEFLKVSWHGVIFPVMSLPASSIVYYMHKSFSISKCCYCYPAVLWAWRVKHCRTFFSWSHLPSWWTHLDPKRVWLISPWLIWMREMWPGKLCTQPERPRGTLCHP